MEMNLTTKKVFWKINNKRFVFTLARLHVYDRNDMLVERNLATRRLFWKINNKRSVFCTPMCM